MNPTNMLSMYFTDTHTTLKTYLFLELCLYSRLYFVYLSAISLTKKKIFIFIIIGTGAI